MTGYVSMHQAETCQDIIPVSADGDPDNGRCDVLRGVNVRPGLQLGLITNYYFIEARSASELFGVGVYWDQPQGDSWMFSLLPAVRVPFTLGEDEATQVYLQGGFGWYHLDMDVLYSGTIPFGGGPVEKRVTEKWDKPGIDGSFGAITRPDGPEDMICMLAQDLRRRTDARNKTGTSR